AGITQLSRVRQLTAADLADQLADDAAIGMGQASGLPGGRQRSVVESRRGLSVEPQAYPQDNEASRLLLEQAIAVAEAAVVTLEPTYLPGGAVKGVQTVEQITELYAIGTDVLHGRRAQGAGDQRQVLQAVEPLVQAPANQLVPALSRLAFDNGTALPPAQHAPAAAAHADHQPPHRAGDNHIAAAAQQGHRPAFPVSQFQCGAQLLLVVHQHQPL